MNYLYAIKMALIFFPIFSLLCSIPFILYWVHNYDKIKWQRIFIVYSFILYLIILYFLVILPLPNKETVIYKRGMINLKPLAFINNFWQETSFVWNDPNTYIATVKEACFYTVILNIFMFIPLGMYLKYYFKCNLKQTIIISLIVSLFLEFTQLTGLYYIYPYPYRVFDVDDLIMNTLGGIIGYLIIRPFKFLNSK